MSARRLKEALKDEFTLRLAVIPGYSLNDFASDLKITPTQLSKVLMGKASLNEEIISQISIVLKWPSDFLSPVEKKTKKVKSTQTRTLVKKITVLKKPNQITMAADIENESLKIVSEWFHYAILDLVQQADFVPDIKFISQKLNIDLATTQDAIHRLVDLSLLKINSDGTWENSSNRN
jgi:uncharacterized protein (TIGR02147 family)